VTSFCLIALILRSVHCDSVSATAQKKSLGGQSGAAPSRSDGKPHQNPALCCLISRVLCVSQPSFFCVMATHVDTASFAQCCLRRHRHAQGAWLLTLPGIPCSTQSANDERFWGSLVLARFSRWNIVCRIATMNDNRLEGGFCLVDPSSART